VLGAKQAEIEVLSLDLGDQVEAEWLPLLGLAYDSKNDVLEVELEGMDHLIPKPRDIYVEERRCWSCKPRYCRRRGRATDREAPRSMALPAPQA
jgi:hypothetical protein